MPTGQEFNAHTQSQNLQKLYLKCFSLVLHVIHHVLHLGTHPVPELVHGLPSARSWVQMSSSPRRECISHINFMVSGSAQHGLISQAGLGPVPDLRVRVQVRVLVICVSTSTSPSTWLLHEYEYESESWLMSTSTSTSTGLWSTFYINSSIAFFSFWKGNPQILMNPG